ncbi:hypothetical protein PIB30_064962 [Stylosanthes scabra]|uniref:Reverse transcriptase zinc-binding domain-containing protein n=1 Tax=Stylosanthes scabra TaxID=79078 RepID=A0ABU6UKT5_9FABA|nr:hypothetical protein [Stylosanthes scabra]
MIYLLGERPEVVDLKLALAIVWPSSSSTLLSNYAWNPSSTKRSGVSCGNSVPIFPKLKFFIIWRSLHEKLPVAALLHRRIPSISPLCRRCNLDMESMMHCLFYCEKAAAVWSESPIDFGLIEVRALTFWELWRDKAENCRLGLCGCGSEDFDGAVLEAIDGDGVNVCPRTTSLQS